MQWGRNGAHQAIVISGCSMVHSVVLWGVHTQSHTRNRLKLTLSHCSAVFWKVLWEQEAQLFPVAFRPGRWRAVKRRGML